ncbi:ferredoxin-thioredoxin reductase catalytic domain-containing protein [Methanobacterium sp.]|uniref:ferredoxin-thioredoxin reductase catalytic domain-containing protein n=1 Tax=Methanobacterium sp. TaxID=2164 RepID=UPI0025FA4335|nr:ferredoxin-thioredoxin reductase catalytic domain-containing protein [Methanobacterium sp.]MBI5459319.1 ferredoxin:glutaredoxin reductase [Methanobacterium sp.]MDY9923727.1 ferredoxin-thioredoxin reductase catalytic domain-containing protein [Methanobacterium sp.]
MNPAITEDDVNTFYERLKDETEAVGYHLNPDEAFTKELLESILINQDRYGYGACPCRLASGVKEEDVDIICPCDYRDPDLDEFGTCYCGLYISSEVLQGGKKLTSIPERRPGPIERQSSKKTLQEQTLSSLPLPVWRCKVCGYLCAREEPPEICPICKVGKERFERFI